MTVNLSLEFRGFIRFLARAKDELVTWYGPHCDYDAAKITFMASKEWDGMADLERKPFIKKDLGTNAYFKYLLHNRYNQKASNDNSNLISTCPDRSQSFHPGHAQDVAAQWHTMSETEKNEISETDSSNAGMKHVLDQRNHLHQAYDPRKLHILEFMLKTKPRWPTSSRLWFLRTESKYIHSPDRMKRWNHLSEDEKNLYERCAVLDSKRYALEKNAWFTKLVGIDLDSDDFSLSDFDLAEIKDRIESLGPIVELSKDMPSLIKLKRPREAFSIFIEAYQYQVRERRPDFKFGQHLKECSNAWKELTDAEKQFYRDESRKLKEKRRELLEGQSRVSPSRLSVPVDLFSPNKSIFGPCRVSHLYPKLPSICSFWASKNSVEGSSIRKLWNDVDPSEKSQCKSDYEDLRRKHAGEKEIIDKKHAFIKRLYKESKNLKLLKQRLSLIGQSNKIVKNLYN